MISQVAASGCSGACGVGPDSNSAGGDVWCRIACMHALAGICAPSSALCCLLSKWLRQHAMLGRMCSCQACSASETFCAGLRTQFPRGTPPFCPYQHVRWTGKVQSCKKCPQCAELPKRLLQNTCKNNRWAPKAMLSGAASCQQWQRRLPSGKLLPKRLLQQPHCQVRHGSAPSMTPSAGTTTPCCTAGAELSTLRLACT